MLNEILEKLANIKQGPCVSLGLNTHRTHPENTKDNILLKNLFQEARIKLAEAYEKDEFRQLLVKIDKLEKEIDHQKNLESLHIFLSNDELEIFRSAWPVEESFVFVGDEFALNALIQYYSESENYYILAISQGGTTLYEAENDRLLEEVRNDDFPYEENPFYTTHSDKASDSKLIDKLLLEYLNGIDKAIQSLYNSSGLKTVVMSTKDMYTKLIQITDNQSAYYDYTAIDYNHLQKDDLLEKAWQVVLSDKHEKIDLLVQEIQQAVPKGNVYTEMHDIVKAAKEGRADLLVIEKGFRYKDQFNDEVLQNRINNRIAWDVLKHQGKVYFADAEQMHDFGQIVLKARY
jgi:hypothetical protein